MKKIILSLLLISNIVLASAQNNAIEVTKTGKGAPVLFLPGFTCPGTVWNDCIQQLKGKYSVHIVSYAGFDGVAPIKFPWYSAIKEQLITYIKNNKLRNITVIGHSMGGTLGMDIAASLPAEVKKLLVVDGLPCMRDLMMPGMTADQFQYDNSYNKQQLKMDAAAFAKNVGYFANSMTNNTAKKDTLKQWMIRADRETYVYGYTDLLKLDLRPDLKNIKAKVLVLAASFPDTAAVQKTLESQFANLSAKTLTIAPDSKHFIFFDQPTWFYTQMNNFINDAKK
jgi:pimeloyl-ACP methyl ester carboxylesterase